MDTNKDIVTDYVEALKKFERLENDIVIHKVINGQKPKYASPDKPFHPEVEKILKHAGIDKLYQHQIDAINNIRDGKNTVIATPTASGKTFIYNIPVFESIFKDKKTKALYLFPLKALAQDQLKTIKDLTSIFVKEKKPTAGIYDGDTKPYQKSKIRKNPPNIVLTNPDMLHLSILPYHNTWKEFLKKLKYIVVDEIHTYRGVMGSHISWVFKRLIRICEYYGAKPVFIFCSATIKNPGELSQNLTGIPSTVINKSTEKRSKKNFIFINGNGMTSKVAILLLHAALHRNMKTIVYSQSRKMTELISIWAASKTKKFKKRISSYRAGLLPEERRKVEEKLSKGELLAVVTTSALELGIDIGALDLCILVGYPGTVMATMQRAGRVGRAGKDSIVILIGHEDALDQYFMNNPESFFKMDAESAVINPYNSEIMSKHLECAASEIPLNINENFLNDDSIKRCVNRLINKIKLVQSESGVTFFPNGLKFPQRKVNLRGTGSTMQIVNVNTGKSIGDIDYLRSFKETHPGAVYLHRGKSFIIREFSPEIALISAEPAKSNYYTKVRSNKDTEIISIKRRKKVGNTEVFHGMINVTEEITGYERISLKGYGKKTIIPLDMPELTFETEGMWFVIPDHIHETSEKLMEHFMGGIHAFEHAAIGILPLMIMTDRNDLGGISIPFHPQVGHAAVFIYDGVPGGIGLTASGFDKAFELLEKTLQSINTCKCEHGCPACVHSPKCGSGNRPIDKYSAVSIIERLLNKDEKKFLKTNIVKFVEKKKKEDEIVKKPDSYGVLDLETKRSAEEVMGWHRAYLMGISCLVLYDSRDDKYHEYTMDNIDELTGHLEELDLIIGFNIIRFDYLVLSGVLDYNFNKLPTLDLLEKVHKRLGYRLSLDHLANLNLGEEKTADGLQALKWWKEGKIRKIIDYCIKDVEITKKIYLKGRDDGFLFFKNKADMKVRFPVKW
ncbi:MAG: DEAD/DEAH box helicase [Desulfobacterales bacterium]|nr:DEAD/DEAH box helicase [Desulfobacterales bacterium]MCP4161078.1 DEAD/DEAH box helicase [Deltaproteobacteria bacterium]